MIIDNKAMEVENMENDSVICGKIIEMGVSKSTK